MGQCQFDPWSGLPVIRITNSIDLSDFIKHKLILTGLQTVGNIAERL